MADPKAPMKVLPIVIEGVEINATNITFQRLQEFSLTMFERLLLQRNERNFLMLERDKLITLISNLRYQIREEESAAVNREAELERAQERYCQDVREVQQEVKYQEYDHKITLDQLKAWESSLVAKLEEDNLKELLELLAEKRKLKEELVESEGKFEEQLMNLKKQQLQDIKELKQKNEDLHIQKEIEFKKRLIEMKEEMTLRHEMEMSEVEERKNCHLSELRKIHKKRLDELKTFFNSVTAENLAVISCMKQSLDGINKTNVNIGNEMNLLKNNNKKLQKPLEKSKAEVKDLTRKLFNYEKDLMSLKNHKRMLEETCSELKELRQESLMALKMLKKCSLSEVRELSGKSCLESMVQFRNFATERRNQLEDLTEKMLSELKKKIKIIKELSEDPDVSQAISKINFELWCPSKLHLELEAAKVAYDEALSTLEEKLEEFCVPKSTLGSKPWRTRPSFAGPAGFVSKQ